MKGTIAFTLLCLMIGGFLGDRYIQRLPNHRGYWLVSILDATPHRVPIPSRPRHTVFIVVDGLRRDAAETMATARSLGEAGQCRVSDQGSYTVSRPEYALLSTGLEVDRSGARNNDLVAPLTAESIWQVAREAKLHVNGSSHLAWFQQLFPEGFDQFNVGQSHEVNVFAESSSESGLVDVNLFHPLYVDENAHLHGAASAEYRAAVARADKEIAGLLKNVDLKQDLVILTADHGHRDQGGHGGAQPEIRNVLACFAGMGVSRLGMNAGVFDGRSTAPTLAALLGLRFPRHMNAGNGGDDSLDQIWDVASETQLGTDYVLDRKREIRRFRNANEVQLSQWLEGKASADTGGRWKDLYEREARSQWVRAALVGISVLLFFGLCVRRSPWKVRLQVGGWLVFSGFVFWAVHHLVLGDFDYTVINLRVQFVPRGFTVAFVSIAAATAAHLALGGVKWRERLITDLKILLAIVLLLNVGHVLVYGWPLGFPLPPQSMRYFPFIGAIALTALALFTLLAAGIDRVRGASVMNKRRFRKPSRA